MFSHPPCMPCGPVSIEGVSTCQLFATEGGPVPTHRVITGPDDVPFSHLHCTHVARRTAYMLPGEQLKSILHTSRSPARLGLSDHSPHANAWAVAGNRSATVSKS